VVSFSLGYCPDGHERIARLRSLYERRAQDRIFAKMEVHGPVLARFAATHEEGYGSRPEPAERAAFWDALLCERQAIHDDAIPCAYLSELDQGLYGGLVGGEIQYMVHPENGWISSMVPPIRSAWDNLDTLEIDTSGEAWRYYLDLLDAIGRQAEGRFGISHFILIDALNFIFELVGATRTYLVVEDEPEKVRRAIDFAYRLNVLVQRTYFERVPLVEGGTCSNMGGWVPGRIVSESVDPFHMTSVAYFERWGREPVERILAAFDGGVVHIHGNGRHLIGAVATIRGLKGVLLANDTGFPPAVTQLEKVRQAAPDLPLIVDVEFAHFVEAFEKHALTGNALYSVRDVPDVDTANRWMERIRDYRV
jgi:hypothetical protein